jgi:hypothetical protein
MKTQSNKVVPVAQDGIPIEVATAMLTESKSKLTSRMRKNCMAARHKVCPSYSPILKLGKDDYAYSSNRGIDAEVKLAKRAKGLKFCQLNSHHARMVKRRAKAQAVYLKLMQSGASEQHKQALGRVLTAQASLLEQAQDALAAEIRHRQAVCSGNSR